MTSPFEPTKASGQTIGWNELKINAILHALTIDIRKIIESRGLDAPGLFGVTPVRPDELIHVHVDRSHRYST